MSSLAAQIWDSEDGRSVEASVLDLLKHPSLESRVIRVSRSAPKPPYVVWLSSLIDCSSGQAYHTATVFDPESQIEFSRVLLQTVYHFTRAEMRLVEQLIAGRTPSEAAEVLGVTIHTVRTYLKRLYHKVDVRSQAMLVRRLMQISSVGRSVDGTGTTADQGP